jgi:hypothetical protein
MTVYVHKMEGQSRALLRGGGWRSRRYMPTDPWFVLTADTDDELHALAASLGLTRTCSAPARRRCRARNQRRPAIPSPWVSVIVPSRSERN